MSAKTKHFLVFLGFVLFCEAAGTVGSIFTVSSVDSWYQTLERPAGNPPGWVFGPVWMTLYFLMGASAYLVWKQYKKSRQAVRRALGVFGVQLLLNILWSVFFFGLRSPGLAFVDIVALFLAIVWTIMVFSKISRVAAYLLVPYLLWVAFAAYLNLFIVILNF